VIRTAERTESELLTLEARVLGGDARLEGELRVTTMDILFRRYEQVFASFIERFPGVELTLICNDNEASLVRREADVALRMTNRPAENLVGRKVGRVDFAVYASKELARRIGRKADLAAWPWLHWDERLDARWLDAWLAANAPGARIAMRVDMSSFALNEAISAGIGVHFLACSEGDTNPKLQRVGPVQEAYSRDVWLLTMDALKTTSRVRAFIDHFVEQTSADRRARHGRPAKAKARS
jgi:DNA-binding transcriptional LysR family regulator